MERYPEYVFGASQPQHYQFVKDHYPELYEKIQEAVAGGRWELQGGMWIEPDCNLISGESTFLLEAPSDLQRLLLGFSHIVQGSGL
jgi:alpha-mannosidase